MIIVIWNGHGNEDFDIYYTMVFFFFYHSHKGCCFVTVIILIATIILPLMLTFGSSDWYTSKWVAGDEKDKGVGGIRGQFESCCILRGNLHKQARRKQMGRGRGGESWLMTPDCQMTLWVGTLAGHLKPCQQPLGTAQCSLTFHLTGSPWSFYCFHGQGNLHSL